MARHKKGDTQHAQNIEKAQHRNAFMARFATFCDEVTDAKTFRLIPKHVHEDLYKKRIQPPRLKAAYGHTIPDATLRDAKSLVTLLFKNTKVPLGIGRIKDISVYDFFTLCVTLWLYRERLKDTDYPEARVVKELLTAMMSEEMAEAYERSGKYMQDNMNLVSLFYSNLDSNLYAVKSEIRTFVDGRYGIMFCMEIYAKKTQVETFTLDGASRPAYRVGLYTGLDFDRILFASLKSEQVLGAPGKELGVYVQAHALQRLSERIDCVDTGVLHYYMYHSLLNVKACRNKKGELLLEFVMNGKKFGYFVALIAGDKLLIRTFLFLTNNGTPEGETLHAHTGIMKEDKIFLQIDKLSTFLNSDINKNERLQNLFIKAGCESLLDVDSSISFMAAGGPMKHVAEYISNYLKKD